MVEKKTFFKSVTIMFELKQLVSFSKEKKVQKRMSVLCIVLKYLTFCYVLFVFIIIVTHREHLAASECPSSFPCTRQMIQLLDYCPIRPPTNVACLDFTNIKVLQLCKVRYVVHKMFFCLPIHIMYVTRLWSKMSTYRHWIASYFAFVILC